MTAISLYLLLPAIVYGGMILNIDVRTPQPKVEVHGEIIHEVTEEERRTFGIEDKKLKNAVAALNDIEPNLVIVEKGDNTTEFTNLFNGWNGVITTVKLRSVNITKQCVHSGNYEFIQNGIKVKSKWNITGNVSIDEKTIYNIYAKENMTFESEWEKDIVKTEDFGKILPSEEEMKRGDIHYVRVIKCDAVLRLEYEANISGDVIAILTPNKVKKLQAYNVADILARTSLPNSYINTEIIYVSYYYRKEENDDVDYSFRNYDYKDYEYYD